MAEEHDFLTELFIRRMVALAQLYHNHMRAAEQNNDAVSVLKTDRRLEADMSELAAQYKEGIENRGIV